MGGGSIEEARRALQLCLRSLQKGDRFDIVGFGSHFEAMFGKSKAVHPGEPREGDDIRPGDRCRYGRHRGAGAADRRARARPDLGHAARCRAADRRRGDQRRRGHRSRESPRRLGADLHHRHRPRPERALHQRRRPRERRRGRVHQTGGAHRAQGAAAVRAARRAGGRGRAGGVERRSGRRSRASSADPDLRRRALPGLPAAAPARGGHSAAGRPAR